MNNILSFFTQMLSPQRELSVYWQSVQRNICVLKYYHKESVKASRNIASCRFGGLFLGEKVRTEGSVLRYRHVRGIL